MFDKVLVIAEAGVNHNGSIDLAKRLIDVAAEAGADYVKFQTFSANQLTILNADKADYQKINTNKQETQYEMLKKLELSKYAHEEIIAHCKKSKIKFLSSGFDVSDVKFLLTLGIELIKVPSGEITNLPYLRYIAGLNLPIALSTGMCTMKEVENALSILEKNGANRNNIAILHCTTNYPTPYQEVNLKAMKTMESEFGVSIGYSDHTMGIEVAIAAVALGAKIIEKHFTIDKNLDGPDHEASLEPNELIAMIKAIRNIEVSFGNGIKIPFESEIKNKYLVRKSIVAATRITKGEIYTMKNITFKRPGNGLSPMIYEEIIGRRAKRDFAMDEQIEL
jgi:N,N'-diacetyllegionaminate synthase